MSRLARFAVGTLACNLLVILWGAVVRATGSGAGCGSHWPLCNGEVVPRSPSLATVIEMTHRATSGLAGLMVIALAVWCFLRLPRRHAARRTAIASLVLVLAEGAVGAGLVLLELVGSNASAARAAYMGAHLVVTFFLLAALALTAWWIDRTPTLRHDRRTAALLALAAVALLVVAASGAVAALGDTLFPAGSLVEGMRQDMSTASHFLLRLRVVHPLLAVTAVAYLLFLPQLVCAARLGKTPRKLGSAISLLALLQLALGAANIGLLAPVALQLLHLLAADLLWIAFVLFGAAALADPRPAVLAAAAAREVAERRRPLRAT
ncbi:MAG TPA: COX15/CtaA family protein [Thermoanaerobaculia bacterium]|nr:COX15/CtaA family protein [Thermoanaerobaculia bacterium]